MSVRFEMRVPDDLMAAIDVARGGDARADWIKRTLAAALGTVPGQDEGSTPVGGDPSHSPRPVPQRAPDREDYAMDRQRKLNEAKYGKRGT
jgi:hypothetical protein